jgi:hypothetical protein
MKTRTTYVVGGVRIPFMKSMTAYRDVTTPELMTASLKSTPCMLCLRINLATVQRAT